MLWLIQSQSVVWLGLLGMSMGQGTELLAVANSSAIILRLGVALLAGAVIGLDRELKEKSAGLRTHILVSLGSAFFVLIPIQLGVAAANSDSLSRVLQGITAGIGFVGGGTIFQSSGRGSKATPVEGLTSAAALWMASGLGVAAGCGLWDLELIGTVLALFTLNGLKRIERHLG